MYKYILKRILLMIPIIFAVSLLIFLILDAMPGDPATIILASSGPTQEELDALNHELGYDRPVLSRYYDYMKGVITKLDFGESYMSRTSVSEEIAKRAPVSIRVAFSAILLASMVGIPIGVLSAVKQYSLFDTIPTFIALFLASTPVFWLGMMFMLVFSLKLGLLPAYGIASWKSYVLPTLALGLPYAAQQLRFTRSSMLETIRSDYVMTARSKGASERRVIWRHAMKNAVMPIITIIGINFGALLGGAIVTETLFSIPGLGMYLVTGIKQYDVPVVTGSAITLAVVFSLVMLLMDLLYALVDPRIKAQYARK
ncbi:MAG: ABC transporter permease [Fastidiosipila sp.]|nr:ABC transporter permease [Fastidiosipila sp.]